MKVVQFIELDVPYCTLTFGVSPCPASLAMTAEDAPQAIFFENSYLSRGAGLTGVSNSKIWTFSCWFRVDQLPSVLGTHQRIFTGSTTLGGSTARSSVYVSGVDDRLIIEGYNAAGTNILKLRSSPLEDDRWYHAIFSVDLSDTNKRHLYINDVNDLNVTFYSNDTMAHASWADWAIGAKPSGDEGLIGDLAEVWSSFSQYVDLSNTTNRRKFVSADKQPVDLGSDGSTPTGTSPRVFLSGDFGSWPDNKGTGGGFTEHGSPLIATESEAGNGKCFQTFATCPVLDHFVESTVTLRFAVNNDYLPPGIEAIPCIKSIDYTAGSVSLGENLGQRSTLSVVFEDTKHPDVGPGFDKYKTERGYDPYERGTLFGKLAARQPYLRNRNVRWIVGKDDQDLADMEVHHLKVDGISGPGYDGKFRLTAKDGLKLADDERATAPKINTGFLSVDMSETDRSFTLFPVGVGENEYPNSGKACIGGGEVVRFTRDSTLGNDSSVELLVYFFAPFNFNDQSTHSRSQTNNGSSIVTNNYKFFGSGVFDGNDNVTFPDDAVFDPGANFAAEGFFRITSFAAINGLFGHGVDGTHRWLVRVNTDRSLTFDLNNSGTLLNFSSAAGAFPDDGAFHHVLLQRTGTSFVIAVDGVSVASTTSSVSFPNMNGSFKIGSGGAGTNFLVGNVELFRFSSVSRYALPFTPPVAPWTNSTDLVFISRGENNTVADTHSAEDRFQVCYDPTAMSASEIIYDLVTNYTDTDPADISFDDIDADVSLFQPNLYTTVVTDPTPVRQLLSEIIRDAALVMGWDDRTPKIFLKVLRGIQANNGLFDNTNILEGSLIIEDQPDKRYSQVWVYYGMIDPTKNLDEPANYRSVEALVDLERESLYGNQVIKTIKSRWIPQFGRSFASKLAGLIMDRYGDPPKKVQLGLLRFHQDLPAIANGYTLNVFPIQDPTGLTIDLPFQITRIGLTEDKYMVEGEEIHGSSSSTDASGFRIITIDTNTFNFNIRSVYDTLFQEPVDGDKVKVIVGDNVIVGSESINLFAMEVGSWPPGVDIVLVMNGRVQGKGGNGGTQKHHDGEDGGGAIRTTYPISIEYGPNGEIWSGAGGAGVFRLSTGEWRDGGGGAGQSPGSNGATSNLATTEHGGDGQHNNDGGDPGEDGQDSEIQTTGGGDTFGGSAGIAIDGISLVTVTTAPGDVRGPTVN